jgi:hypothetical protein
MLYYKETEIFKIIEEFPEYVVSNYGRVCKISTGNEIKHNFDKYGYHIVCLRGKSYKVNVRIPYLVIKTFKPNNPDNLPCVDTIDGNRNNNFYNNLEYVSKIRFSNQLKSIYTVKQHNERLHF